METEDLEEGSIEFEDEEVQSMDAAQSPSADGPGFKAHPLRDSELEAYLAEDELVAAMRRSSIAAPAQEAATIEEVSPLQETASASTTEQQQDDEQVYEDDYEEQELVEDKAYADAVDADVCVAAGGSGSDIHEQASSTDDSAGNHSPEPQHGTVLMQQQSEASYQSLTQDPQLQAGIAAAAGPAHQHETTVVLETAVSSACSSTYSAATTATTAGNRHNDKHSSKGSSRRGSSTGGYNISRSSKHSSMHSRQLSGVHGDLQELWEAAGLPARATTISHNQASTSGAGDDGFLLHHQRFEASSSNDGSPVRPAQKQRPASASPALRTSSSSQQQSACTSGSLTGRRASESHEVQPASQQYQPSPGQQGQQQAPDVMPVKDWAVGDVCDWVDGLGLYQYRKKFMHHVVDGRLLMRLNDTMLRTELGIGPLGHRVLLLEAIQAIAAADLQAAAAAAAAGMTPEELCEMNCSSMSSPSAAAAVLVAGVVGQRAAQSICHCSSSPWGFAAGGADNAGGVFSPGSPAGYGGRPRSPPGLRGRPNSAPCKGRRSRCQSPQGDLNAMSPGALGPAAGRISVYEQRARILFDLGRAQARAAAVAGTATEVADVARIAQKEVAVLQGQLADLDKKNKLAVQHASGSLDTRGIIPWQHVGNGTKAADPFPERHARPWDSPDVELTFQPKISGNSQRIMAEARGGDGAGGFLDRLDYDLRRREVKQKELERRYYGGKSADAAAAKVASADLALLASYLDAKGWASLSVPSGSSKVSEADMRELDSQLDEVVETYSKELGLGKSDSRQSQAILAAHGPKKIAAMAAAVRTQQFMDRYHNDLSTRGSRLQQLQDSWMKQQISDGRGAPVVLTPEQKDLQQATLWFKGLGWQEAADEDDCDSLLAALIKRARHYKTEAEKLHDKERAAVAAGSASPTHHASALPKPNVNWQTPPWSSDRLGPLVQKIVDSKKAAAEVAAAKAAAAAKPSAVDAALKAAGKQQGSSPAAASGGNAAAAGGVDSPLDTSVRLIAGMRWAGLEQLDAASGRTKKLAVYRALRTQQFLAFTAADLSAREAKQQAMLRELEAGRRGKVVSKAELDEFYNRLQADGDRRKFELQKARTDKADREAKALALVSVAPGRFSHRRPRSART